MKHDPTLDQLTSFTHEMQCEMGDAIAQCLVCNGLRISALSVFYEPIVDVVARALRDIRRDAHESPANVLARHLAISMWR